ncbi:protein diaphanous homolog 1 [Aplysia californica]|uniref:Protein diaphanous homolog 1 n=1 Tax=Aplysia californica TaxID=6500 RepID=A0ABM0JX26_APLCA|nr:protein diaphanous homolog 1 [Aplysia californica]
MSSLRNPGVDKKDKDKDKNRNSFFDKVGAPFKSKTKHKSTSSAPSKGYSYDDHGFNGGDPFTDSVDVTSMADFEINERFEQLLDDMNLTEEKKAPLRNKNVQARRQMLELHMRGAVKVRVKGLQVC